MKANIIKRFSDFLKINENQNIIDQLLDKISTSGIESLSGYEKEQLDKLSNSQKVELKAKEDALEWLTVNYGDLNHVREKLPSFGKMIETDSYVDSDANLIVSIQNTKVSVVDSVWDKISSYYNLDDDSIKDIIRLWLKQKYGIRYVIHSVTKIISSDEL